jgi:hypothetical protein
MADPTPPTMSVGGDLQPDLAQRHELWLLQHYVGKSPATASEAGG